MYVIQGRSGFELEHRHGKSTYRKLLFFHIVVAVVVVVVVVPREAN